MFEQHATNITPINSKLTAPCTSRAHQCGCGSKHWNHFRRTTYFSTGVFPKWEWLKGIYPKKRMVDTYWHLKGPFFVVVLVRSASKLVIPKSCHALSRTTQNRSVTSFVTSVKNRFVKPSTTQVITWGSRGSVPGFCHPGFLSVIPHINGMKWHEITNQRSAFRGMILDITRILPDFAKAPFDGHRHTPRPVAPGMKRDLEVCKPLAAAEDTFSIFFFSNMESEKKNSWQKMPNSPLYSWQKMPNMYI